MPKPHNVGQTTRLIINAGIANRLVIDLPWLPHDFAGCAFWAEVVTHRGAQVLCIQAECPMWDGSRQTSSVMVTDKTFGSGPALNQEQILLVRQLVAIK